MNKARILFLAAVLSSGALAGRLHADSGGTGQDIALARALGMVPSSPRGTNDRRWQLNAATGWDSLYVDRGVNVLGNGNGLGWWAVDTPLSVWEGGTLTPGVWFGTGSHWNGVNAGQAYKEWLVFADLTQQVGPISVSVGWEYVYVPMSFEAQNEIYFGLAHELSVGALTITPSALWYYNLGPQKGHPGGAINGGASFGMLGLHATMPVAHNGAVAFEPWTALGINFNYNERAGDPLLGVEGEPFIGGNHWEVGAAIPLALNDSLTLAPYAAASYQWQNLGAGGGSGTGLTDAVTFWAGVSMRINF